MKYCAILSLFSICLCAQTPSDPPGVFPPGSSQALPANPPVPPDTVVAEVDGKKLTAADLDKIVAGLPPPVQQTIRTNPGQALPQLFLFQHLAEMAQTEKLDQQSPYKESLEYQRAVVLAQAEMNTYRYKFPVTNEELKKVYDAHPERFRQAKVRAIFISFGANAAEGSKTRSEPEAKSKVDDLRRQILAGADFGKLARENSEDQASAAKAGDFGFIRAQSPYPETFKNAVFSLKAGEVSEPVRQPSGFYLIRVDETGFQPMDELVYELSEEVRTNKFNEWIKGLQSRYQVKIENSNYFASKPQAQLPAPR